MVWMHRKKHYFSSPSLPWCTWDMGEGRGFLSSRCGLGDGEQVSFGFIPLQMLSHLRRFSSGSRSLLVWWEIYRCASKVSVSLFVFFVFLVGGNRGRERRDEYYYSPDSFIGGDAGMFREKGTQSCHGRTEGGRKNKIPCNQNSLEKEERNS